MSRRHPPEDYEPELEGLFAPKKDVAHARSTDPGTSHAAAASVTNQRRIRARILLILEAGPMTDERLIERWPIAWRGTPSGIRTRRSELVADGLVVDSGKREKLVSGREAIVWRIAK